MRKISFSGYALVIFIWSAIIIFVFAPFAYSQATASRFDTQVTTINQGSPQPGPGSTIMYPMLAIPGSIINICNSPAIGLPCTNKATTYTDTTKSTACPSNAQVTQAGSHTCTQFADAQGGWGVWIGAGNYTYTITTSYGSFGPFDFTAQGITSCASPGTCTIQGDLVVTGAISANIISSPQVNFKVIAGSYSSLNAAATACPLTGGCTIEINTTVPLSANLTIPATTLLIFNSPGRVNLNGFNLVINGPINALNYSLFTTIPTSGQLTYGTLITTAPAEWTGAVGDWNGSTGTDNTTALQSTINALSSGCMALKASVYEVTSALSITKSNVGICGVASGYKQFSLNPGGTSTIMQTSASSDTIDVVGPSIGSPITWNSFTNFAIERSVLPSGAAKGLSLKYVAGYVVRGITSQDSIYNFWIHGSPQYVTGGFQYDNAGWGSSGGPSYSGFSSNVYGFYLDGTGGEASGTFFADNINTTNATGFSGFTSIGIELNGNAINDVFINMGGSFLVTTGAVINCTAVTAGIGCQDIHFTNSVFDANEGDAVQISGINSSAHGTVQFIGGWLTPSSAPSTACMVRITNSSFVQISNIQIQPYATNGICTSNSNTLDISHNQIYNSGNSSIILDSTSFSVIEGNVIETNVNTVYGILARTGSIGNQITGNVIAIGLSVTSTAAIAFDATSNSNADQPNMIGGPWAIFLSDLGSNNGRIANTNSTSPSNQVLISPTGDVSSPASVIVRGNLAGVLQANQGALDEGVGGELGTARWLSFGGNSSTGGKVKIYSLGSDGSTKGSILLDPSVMPTSSSTASNFSVPITYCTSGGSCTTYYMRLSSTP